ncbi:MAG: hypothetical protein A3F67_09120 [Verrucomicrobia bacterium RIFCSPHIGHO2_12_FULL_41_10]|nr:MAG: hypothetical protein A3F67_09120 [Verrucomicrobia bacterium RIFCSPHIGHO2_12_FULL_41_10]HLB33045.1 phytoene/squalene synthase family protein [Chthoniobacterales bacterium]
MHTTTSQSDHLIQILPPKERGFECLLVALRSNLAIALYLLPRAQRRDALLFYKFCHSIDHCVDHSLLTLPEKEVLLNQWLTGIQNLPSSRLPTDFQEMIVRRKLDTNLLCEIIRGVLMDLTIHRYATFNDLRGYIWRVASAVGLVSVQIFGTEGPDVTQYAEALGIAFQLTNILRDVAEDAAMSRIYLPLEDLSRFSVTEEEILQSTPSPQATHLFHYEGERALSYFAKAELAWESMPVHQQRLMRPARLMEAIYRTLLNTMQKDRYDLFYRHYRVSAVKKGILALQVFL